MTPVQDWEEIWSSLESILKNGGVVEAWYDSSPHKRKVVETLLQLSLLEVDKKSMAYAVSDRARIVIGYGLRERFEREFGSILMAEDKRLDGVLGTLYSLFKFEWSELEEDSVGYRDVILCYPWHFDLRKEDKLLYRVNEDAEDIDMLELKAGVYRNSPKVNLYLRNKRLKIYRRLGSREVGTENGKKKLLNVNGGVDKVCLFCGSSDVIKGGVRKRKDGDVQMWICKKCRRRFTLDVTKNEYCGGLREDTCYLHFKGGLSVREVMDILDRKYNIRPRMETVQRWFRTWYDLRKEDVDAYVDELVHFVQVLMDSGNSSLEVHLNRMDLLEQLDGSYSVQDIRRFIESLTKLKVMARKSKLEYTLLTYSFPCIQKELWDKRSMIVTEERALIDALGVLHFKLGLGEAWFSEEALRDGNNTYLIPLILDHPWTFDISYSGERYRINIEALSERNIDLERLKALGRFDYD